MAEPKTKATALSVADFLAAQPDAERRADCEVLVTMMSEAAAAPAVLWGTSIVGFGSYEVPAGAGKTNPWPRIGFAPRKNDLTLYLLMGDEPAISLLARLGRHKMGKSCLHLKRLADVDLAVLRQLIEESLAQMGRQHP